MKIDLPERTQMLFDRVKAFPEAKWTEEGLFLKKDAGVAFLDLRRLLEKEILPALHELRREQQEWVRVPRLEE